MKTGRLSVGVTSLLLAILAVSLPSCSSKKSTNSGGTTSTLNVTVSDNSFSPRTDSVAVGARVTWTYNGIYSTHTVTSDTGTFLSSGNLSSGNSTYSKTFSTMGDFYYHCAYHGTAGTGGSFGSGMTGVVKVR